MSKITFFSLFILLSMLPVASQSQTSPLQPTNVRESVGINIHFIVPKPGEMSALSRPGLYWARRDLPWSATERQKGVYDFHQFDALLADLKRGGMRPLFILDYGNSLYTDNLPPHDNAGRQAFARWAVAAVTHYQNQGILWEIYNEPNNKEFWKPTPNADDYAALVLTVGAALQKAAPNEIVIGPGCAAMDFHYLERCFQLGALQYWSAVSVHPYRKSDPESVGVDYGKLRSLIQKYALPGRKIAIVSSEWGYPTVWVSEATQTDYLVREFLFNIANDIPVSIWYDWRHGGKNDQRPDIFGLVDPAYHPDRNPVLAPRPIYIAAAALIRLLGDFHYSRTIPIGTADEDYALAFTGTGGPRYAIWTTNKSPQVVTLPVPLGRYEIFDELGQRLRSSAANSQGLKVTLTGSPQYVLPEK